MLSCVNDRVTTIKPGHQSNEKARMILSDESFLTLLPTSRRDYVLRTTKEAYNPECLVPAVKHELCFVMVWAAMSWYSVLLVPLLPFMAELLQGNMWTGWVIRCIHDPHVISEQRCKDSVFQDDSVHIHTAGTVQSRFEEHEGELQHLP
jgi:hypothetical protein